MSAEVKVLSISTRTNLEALKHHMKKLGFKYFRENNSWVDFGTQLYDTDKIDPTNRITIGIRYVHLYADIGNFDLISKLPEAKQAVLDFYEAEGITE